MTLLTWAREREKSESGGTREREDRRGEGMMEREDKVSAEEQNETRGECCSLPEQL